MVNSVSFAIRMYRHNSLFYKQCCRVAFSEMDAIFRHHDNHNTFSKQLMDCKNSYQQRLKKEYLGI